MSLVLQHIGTSALMDLLLRLVSCVEPTGLRQEVLHVSVAAPRRLPVQRAVGVARAGRPLTGVQHPLGPAFPTPPHAVVSLRDRQGPCQGWAWTPPLPCRPERLLYPRSSLCSVEKQE